MIRKCSCIVCVICMTLAMGVKVKAEELRGTLQVLPTWCGQLVAGGTVMISRVGVIEDDKITLTDGLANWQVEESELTEDTWTGWLSQHTDGKKQFTAVCDENGAAFENLEAGIYLVEQSEHAENYMPFRSFLQVIPENGYWNMSVRPKLIYSGEPPRTADRPAPIIGAMGIGLSAAILIILADSRKK